MRYTTLICFFILISNCSTTEPLNEIPMYGRLPKSPKNIEADNQFINTVLNQLGSKDSACKYFASQGFSLLSYGDNRTAIKRFNQAWLFDTTNAKVYWGFAYYLENNGKYKDAVPMFEKAIYYDPENYKIWIGYAICFSLIASEEMNSILKEEYFKKSESIFIRIEKVNNKSGDLYFGWAQKWHKQGDEEKANIYLQKAKDLGFQR